METDEAVNYSARRESNKSQVSSNHGNMLNNNQSISKSSSNSMQLSANSSLQRQSNSGEHSEESKIDQPELRGSNSMFNMQRPGFDSPIKRNQPKLNQSSLQLNVRSLTLARNAHHSEKKTKSHERRVVKRVFLDEHGKEEGV